MKTNGFLAFAYTENAMFDHDVRSSASAESRTPDGYDAVIEFYKAKVDRQALRENLKLTPAQRIKKLQKAIEAELVKRRNEDRRREPTDE